MMWWNRSCGLGGWAQGGWGLLLQTGIMLLIAAGIIFGFFLLLRLASGSGRSSTSGPDGLAILDERYARGEIERDEYLQKKQDIAP
jgi:putative membrane protein